jgi:hypothetical protein
MQLQLNSGKEFRNTKLEYGLKFINIDLATARRDVFYSHHLKEGMIG